MMRTRGVRAFAALVCALALTATAAACSSSSDSSGGGSGSNGDTTGINGSVVRVGIAVSDLDGLRASGIQLAAALTTNNLAKRLSSYLDDWNKAGGINGYTFEPVTMVWDPVKPATAEKVCDDATVNDQVFAFINASGMGAKYVECIAAAGVPTFFGDVAPQSAHDTGWFTSISPSAELNASSGVKAAIAAGQIPKGAKVGVLVGNGPEHVAAATAAEAELKANGNTVTVARVNTLGGDAGVQNTESAAAVNAFRAAGVTNAVVGLQFTAARGFYDAAAGAGFKFTILDVASSMCTAYGATQISAAAMGSDCFTVFGDSVTNNGKLATETPFEQECRAKFDALSAKTKDYPTKSSPGVPSGSTYTLPDGTVLSSDYPPNECTISVAIKRALEKAGKNLSRESFMKALRGLGEVDVALASNGKGTQEPGKTYFATLTHSVKLTAGKDAAKGSNGLFNGCAAPYNCWVPNSPEWFAIN